MKIKRKVEEDMNKDDQRVELKKTKEKKKSLKGIVKEGNKLKNRKKKNIPKERTTNTIFIGNVSTPHTTSDDLIKLFKQFGKIVSARLRMAIPEKETVSKKVAVMRNELNPNVTVQCGYIKFEKKDSCEKAVEKSGDLFLHDHHLFVDFADKKPDNDDNETSLFIGSLPFDVTEEEIYNRFIQYGHIKHIRLIRDKQTGIGKGFGFIKFSTKEETKKILETNEIIIKNQILRIQRSGDEKEKEEKPKKKLNSIKNNLSLDNKRKMDKNIVRMKKWRQKRKKEYRKKKKTNLCE
ncbi:hypothetical protein SNEBB_007832 [Seison nebaliae]|nr:hypothetical protein SNEBB_007832 [Seison nebaliae]